MWSEDYDNAHITSNCYILVTFAMYTQAFCHPLLLSRRPIDSNDNGDVNDNGKNAIGLISKTKTLHVHHAFLYISYRHYATTTGLKCLFSRLVEDVNIQPFRIQVQKKLPTFGELNPRYKREKVWSSHPYFLGDVFVAVTVVVS